MGQTERQRLPLTPYQKRAIAVSHELLLRLAARKSFNCSCAALHSGDTSVVWSREQLSPAQCMTHSGLCCGHTALLSQDCTFLTPCLRVQLAVVQAAVIAGGSLYGASRLHSVVLHAQRVQRDICSDVQDRCAHVKQSRPVPRVRGLD